MHEQALALDVYTCANQVPISICKFNRTGYAADHGIHMGTRGPQACCRLKKLQATAMWISMHCPARACACACAISSFLGIFRWVLLRSVILLGSTRAGHGRLHPGQPSCGLHVCKVASFPSVREASWWSICPNCKVQDISRDMLGQPACLECQLTISNQMDGRDDPRDQLRQLGMSRAFPVSVPMLSDRLVQRPWLHIKSLSRNKGAPWGWEQPACHAHLPRQGFLD